jgi:hypothetical protein
MMPFAPPPPPVLNPNTRADEGAARVSSGFSSSAALPPAPLSPAVVAAAVPPFFPNIQPSTDAFGAPMVGSVAAGAVAGLLAAAAPADGGGAAAAAAAGSFPPPPNVGISSSSKSENIVHQCALHLRQRPKALVHCESGGARLPGVVHACNGSGATAIANDQAGLRGSGGCGDGGGGVGGRQNDVVHQVGMVAKEGVHTGACDVRCGVGTLRDAQNSPQGVDRLHYRVSWGPD